MTKNNPTTAPTRPRPPPPRSAGAPSRKRPNGWRGTTRSAPTSWSFSGKKFDPRNADDARKAAEAVGLKIASVDTVANDGTNGPRGIPAKGPAEKITKIIGEVTLNSGVEFVVRELNTKQSTSRPPGPFMTSTLQQAASNALGFGAQRTMKVAQQLYEGVDLGGDVGAVGLITYMRTDSQNLSADAVKMVRTYIDEQIGPKYLPEQPNVFAARANAQGGARGDSAHRCGAHAGPRARLAERRAVQALRPDLEALCRLPDDPGDLGCHRGVH